MYQLIHWWNEQGKATEQKKKEKIIVTMQMLLWIIYVNPSRPVHYSKLYWNKNQIKFLFSYFFVVPQKVEVISVFEHFVGLTLKGLSLQIFLKLQKIK